MRSITESEFWSRAQRDENGCLLWTASLTECGYGRITWRRLTTTAHRLAWTLTHGPIPKGKSVLHKCDVPACIEPSHLFLGTQADNVRDMIEKGRWAPVGTGANNPNKVQITMEQALEIRQMYVEGTLTVEELASTVGFSRKLVRKVLEGSHWSVAGLSPVEIRRKFFGTDNPFYGRQHSKETRVQISRERMGKARSFENGNNKLSKESVLEIRRRWPEESQTALAKEFGISQSLVSQIVRNAARKECNGPDAD